MAYHGERSQQLPAVLTLPMAEAQQQSPEDRLAALHVQSCDNDHYHGSVDRVKNEGHACASAATNGNLH